jgi:hypothetical protein
MADEKEQMQWGDESYKSKITIKDIGCDPKKVATAESGNHPLARIYGVVHDVTAKESKTIAGNIEVAFIGEFEAINLEDGRVFRSGRLYLPKGISEVMEKTFAGIKSSDKNATVEFAFEIASVKASNPIGYSYEAKALRKATQVDALADLRNTMKSLPAVAVAKALPAGKPVDSGKAKR